MKEGGHSLGSGGEGEGGGTHWGQLGRGQELLELLELLFLLLKEVSLLLRQAEAGITQMRRCREAHPTPRSSQTPSDPGKWTACLEDLQ